MLCRVDDVGAVIGLVSPAEFLLIVYKLLVCHLAETRVVGDELVKLVLSGNLGACGFDDGPAQTLCVAGGDEGVFKVGCGLTPAPAVAYTVTAAGDDCQ